MGFSYLIAVPPTFVFPVIFYSHETVVYESSLLFHNMENNHNVICLSLSKKSI